ncbi:MAG: integration host factor subunit alpha [Gammaproteobacteria bacterium]|nr:integration host factor subunit alpha [Gammaproteobacteria bacterium]MDE0282286.1 integration host factor subunit alpha [Gammaproteobacteria bacterium]MDE0715082.1 integration host factor subunit alpha [Gammaproteobacteria bacterium]MXY65948.1 integration host factor subunit alpha [Gammaproteobacteria bacterium]MYG66951.1 integration host factor subunit alpha [Gammaproteobacteria bacterium]
MTITKADLCNVLFDEVGLNKREAKEFVELFFEKIRQSLEEGVAVKLSGFGSFTLRDKTSRPGRNPKTGEEVAISARRVVTFRSSQKLKQSVVDNSFELTQRLGRKR